MAIILNECISGKRCIGCGLEIKDTSPIVILPGAREVIYLHSNCAESLAKRLLADISQLVDLGYYHPEDSS